MTGVIAIYVLVFWAGFLSALALGVLMFTCGRPESTSSSVPPLVVPPPRQPRRS